ncbi:hypothetical protein CCR75_007806 [Bremia lactucae]|uniref:Uncharacterized protein n=1 Tax=Bremia lactucae TaxID=4779 RepID=A0A976IL39_BRELC|nr:hypothetical protein CCR75_007806 [Bremia lactucae]
MPIIDWVHEIRVPKLQRSGPPLLVLQIWGRQYSGFVHKVKLDMLPDLCEGWEVYHNISPL